ncbi:unnamed protein product [Urochloa decumbens]|uniref:Uncharacterized protein n=1 Tax=Urochloa decumbens TaxID=240449 RepID=A0ABC9GCI9_9POAL
MATIVNTTEEELMLAVTRFTAELAWADAGPEVADPEVTPLCLETQEHILPGRWLDMASLMLASADLLLTSPSLVPEKDLECILSVICSLVNKVGSEDQVLQITELICAKLTQQPDNKPALCFKVLFSLYNLLPSPYGKAFRLQEGSQDHHCREGCRVHHPVIQEHDSFVPVSGELEIEQMKLYLAIARILKDHKGMTKEYFNFLNKYLAIFKGSDDDSATIGDAKEEAVVEIVELVKSSTLFQYDILNMPAVAQLEMDEKVSDCKLCLAERLCRCSGEIPYSAIIEALQITDDEAITISRHTYHGGRVCAQSLESGGETLLVLSTQPKQTKSLRGHKECKA